MLGSRRSPYKENPVMGKLADILSSDRHDELTRVFNNVDAAPNWVRSLVGDGQTLFATPH
ncbi:MAG TPA: hypothetical protein DCE43_22150 [Planctomycetaceae bacterium]|nr:hypothetical protein [Planctomycetaceae bacterium]HCK53342.1 hypothetical protein [Planctomycetaceae bacterium]